MISLQQLLLLWAEHTEPRGQGSTMSQQPISCPLSSIAQHGLPWLGDFVVLQLSTAVAQEAA